MPTPQYNVPMALSRSDTGLCLYADSLLHLVIMSTLRHLRELFFFVVAWVLVLVRCDEIGRRHHVREGGIVGLLKVPKLDNGDTNQGDHSQFLTPEAANAAIWGETCMYSTCQHDTSQCIRECRIRLAVARLSS